MGITEDLLIVFNRIDCQFDVTVPHPQASYLPACQAIKRCQTLNRLANFKR